MAEQTVYSTLLLDESGRQFRRNADIVDNKISNLNRQADWAAKITRLQGQTYSKVAKWTI